VLHSGTSNSACVTKSDLPNAGCLQRLPTACCAKEGEREDQAVSSQELKEDSILGAGVEGDEGWDSSDSEDEDGQQILLEQEGEEDPFDSHSSKLITQEVLLFCFQQVSVSPC